MNKKPIPILKLALLITLFAAGAIHAEDVGDKAEKKRSVYMSIGGTVYYAWWKPVWRDELSYLGPSLVIGKHNTDRGNLLYGPIIALTIKDKWTISGTFLYGRYRFLYSGTSSTSAITLLTLYNRWYRISFKYDGDLLVGYKLNKYCKLFFGPKYQGYYYSYRGYVASGSGIIPYSEKITYHSGGIGIGAGFKIPIVNNFFILPNISFQTVMGRIIEKKIDASNLSVAFGGNAVVNLAYFITPINASIMIGGRFQYLYYYIKPMSRYTDSHDMFYGINASLVFTF